MATNVYAILFLVFYGLLMLLFVYTSSVTTLRGHKEVVKGRKEDEEED